MILVAVLVLAMTLVYFGSIVNPAGHLKGLPVTVVNEDTGASVGSQRVDFGQQLTTGLTRSPVLSSRLSLRPSTLAATRERMDVGKEFAAIVIPPGFTASLLAIAGVPTATPSTASTSRPTVELLTNPRAGTLGVSLAAGVVQPALATASRQIGERLVKVSPARPANAGRALLTDPVAVAAVPFRPLPSHTGLLVFVYLALASSGGTVPLDALSGFFRFLANFEPLRQILDGVRAILYFDARGAAGLTRAWIASGLGLVFWVILGILVTNWYDRKRLHRMPPEVMAYVDRAVSAYRNETEQPIATSHGGLKPGSPSASQPEGASHPQPARACSQKIEMARLSQRPIRTNGLDRRQPVANQRRCDPPDRGK